MDLRFLSAADVVRALPMADAIVGMKTAFAQLSAGQAEAPLRSRVDVAGRGTLLAMPAYLAGGGDLAIKVVSVFPDNAARGRPIIQALVMALDAATGQPLAVMEGSSVTAIRTGAGAGAATDVLARFDAEVAAIIGSGVQARTQLEAVCTVRPIREARVYSLTRSHAEQFADTLAGRGPVPASIRVMDDADAAVRDADVICTATTSATPVFSGSALKPGAHVNAVGSYTPAMQEVDFETILRSLVVVDSRPAVLAEAGDLLIPLRAGIIGEDHIHAELGEIINGQKTGRTRADQITYFKSVGVAVQDASAAGIALENAVAKGVGVMVRMG